MKKALAIWIASLFATISPLIVSELVTSTSPERRLSVAQGTIFALVIYVIIIVVYAMKVEFKLTLSHSRLRANLTELTNKYNSVQGKLWYVDSEIRKQVSLWLHGTVQSKLMKISRKARDMKSSEAESLANQLDDLTENIVRNFSHQLFPPALHISLEAGLLELVGNTADLDLDQILSSRSDLGTGLDLGSGTGDTFPSKKNHDLPKRLFLKPALAFAMYRVIEEGLSNAGKKMSVTAINVSVKVKAEHIQIIVEDNGEKIQSTGEPGLGFTLFDVYASQFGGSWVLENSFGGVALRMTFLFTPETVEQTFFKANNERP